MARRGAGPPPGPDLFGAGVERSPGGEPEAREPAAPRPERAGAPPLAARVRPRDLADVVGHVALVGPGKPLALALAQRPPPSMILWGPPGSGKTTLAELVAHTSGARFVPFSAVLGGVADVRRIVDEARRHAGPTVLFVDEIHRFNKAQQDAFLPHVEDGTIALIGATTENPSFALTGPLLSRCVVYRLEPLGADDVVLIVRRALAHPDGFAGALGCEDEAAALIAATAEGDARRALGLLERAAEHARKRGRDTIVVDDVRELGVRRTLAHDRAGDAHYDVASAFIKSLRGSDPDAALYWMMRMVEAGDDPLFVLRRMLIFASEDVGNADPRALAVAVDADRAFQRLGLPEGLYAMAQACVYLACAPKSNATNLAWHRAQAAVRERGSLPVPVKLRNAPTKLLRELGHGAGYRYAHDEPGGVAAGETYLPDELVGARYYEPTDRGLEKALGERLALVRKRSE
ncbi:MAG: replication-associated recombination protein A [Myxococcales bacterium]|nr:replication-associated recombination protein A [Myxococcales bacterium]